MSLTRFLALGACLWQAVLITPKGIYPAPGYPTQDHQGYLQPYGAQPDLVQEQRMLDAIRMQQQMDQWMRDSQRQSQQQNQAWCTMNPGAPACR